LPSSQPATIIHPPRPRILIHIVALSHPDRRAIANATRIKNIARARELLAVPEPIGDTIKADGANPDEPRTLNYPCPCCGGPMTIIETFERGATARYKPSAPAGAMRIDTS
jgi:hypothetical protein